MTAIMGLMRSIMQKNPTASEEELRREFIRRALADGEVAARIIHNKAGELYRAISQKEATRGGQAVCRRAFYDAQAQRAEQLRAKLLRRMTEHPSN
jgi:hypothetical protein